MCICIAPVPHSIEFYVGVRQDDFEQKYYMLSPHICDGDLCKSRSFTGRRQKASYGVMKSTLNLKGIHICCIQGVSDSVTEFCGKRGESDKVIIGTKVKVSSSVSPNDLVIDTDMCLSEEHSSWIRGIIRNGQFNSTSRTTH